MHAGKHDFTGFKLYITIAGAKTTRFSDVVLSGASL